MDDGSGFAEEGVFMTKGNDPRLPESHGST